MIRFLVRRTVHAAIVVIVVLTVTFLVVNLAPGDPLLNYYDPDIDPDVMETVRERLGLDAPLPVRYARTITGYVTGDFGTSFRSQRPVADVLGEAIGRTLPLAGCALVIQLLVGVGLGALAALHRHRGVDRAASTLALFFYSMPSFYLAFGLIGLFALEWGWLPAAGMQSVDANNATALAALGDRARHMALPVAVLTLTSAAILVRYTRGRFIDVLHEEHVRTARAKGLPDATVVRRHVIHNALPQLLTLVGLSVPALLAGAVVVEKVFAWPGMGSLMVDAIYARDYPVVLAAAYAGAVIVVVSNLLVDIAHAWVDPRVRRPTEVET